MAKQNFVYSKINLPNFITLIRLLFIPIIVFLLKFEHKFWALILIFLFLLLDIIDGYIAKKYNQITDFGSKFDAVVDTLFFIIIYLALIILYDINILYSVLIIFPKLVSPLVFYFFSKTVYASKTKYSTYSLVPLLIFLILALFGCLNLYFFIVLLIIEYIIYYLHWSTLF